MLKFFLFLLLLYFTSVFYMLAPCFPPNFKLYGRCASFLSSLLLSLSMFCSILCHLQCPNHTPTPTLFLFSSLSLLTSLPSCPRPPPFLQSHPALWDKVNIEDQFCSVTFGGGLQSKGMVGELELREIYLGCPGEK